MLFYVGFMMYLAYQGNHVERLLGGLEVFLKYANDYVSTFSGKSIDTFQWKDHLYSYFRKNGGEEKIKLLDSIDWDVNLPNLVLSCALAQF